MSKRLWLILDLQPHERWLWLSIFTIRLDVWCNLESLDVLAIQKYRTSILGQCHKTFFGGNLDFPPPLGEAPKMTTFIAIINFIIYYCIFVQMHKRLKHIFLVFNFEDFLQKSFINIDPRQMAYTPNALNWPRRSRNLKISTLILRVLALDCST